MIQPGKHPPEKEMHSLGVAPLPLPRKHSGQFITPRAVFLSLLLIPLNAFMLLHISIIRHQAYPTSYALFGNVVAILAALTLLNSLLRRWMPDKVLSPGELVTCYIMLCIASALSNDQTVFLLLGVIGHPTWFATPTNNWAALFGKSLPGWLTVQDRGVLQGFYQGVSSFWQWEVIAVWLPPLLAWLVFLMVLLGVMLCINTIVRQYWTEAQRLSYPLITLPIQMVDPKEGLFRSKLMWSGFAIVAVLNVVNGVNILIPSFPSIPRHIDLTPIFFIERPWTAFLAFPNARVPIGIYPFIFGLGLLMPLDLVFSCWFFYLVARFSAVAMATRGWETISGFPFDVDAASGGFVGIFVYVLWQMRSYLQRVLRKAFRNDPTIDDSREPMRYRTAVLGLILGMIFLIGFSMRAGISLALAFGFFLFYFLFSTVITRMRTEAGITSHDVYLGGPDVLLVNSLGTSRLSQGDLTGMSLMFWYNRAYDSHPMPQQLEGYRLGERTGVSMRRLTGAMLLAGGAGAVAAMLIGLHVMYQMGAASGKVTELVSMSSETWSRLASWVASPTDTNWHALTARGIGFTLTLALYSLRNYGLWCPFHPVGVAMAGSWAMYKIWSSLFFSWLIKWGVLRYGGRAKYASLVHFGLGLVLGDCVLGTFWALIGAAFNIPTFGVWP